LPRAPKPKIGLGDHDGGQAQAAGLDHHPDDGQHHGQLVGDELAGRSEAAHQRVLVGRRPPGDEHADDRHRRDGQGVEDAGVEVGEPGVRPEGHGHVHEEDRPHHEVGGELEERAVGPLGDDVLLLEGLAHLGEELERPVRPRLHRPEPRLEVRHHLEQVDVDERPRREQDGGQHPDHAEPGLLPVGQLRDHTCTAFGGAAVIGELCPLVRSLRSLTGRCPPG
jgi:hypothetical protein